MRLHHSLVNAVHRPYLPRRTVRLRLTLLYGSLFLLSGAGLLAITYVFVSKATDNACVSPGKGASVCGFSSGSGLSHGQARSVQVSGGAVTRAGTGIPRVLAGPKGLTSKQMQAQAHQIQALAAQQHTTELHQLLIRSGIALGIMGLLSIVLGWIVAGRVLRPLRTITAAARDISATNLHQRLALAGPDDKLKELGDTFDGLLTRLEASFQSQRQFVANASHELRTPLARQRALAQVALGDPDATVESLRLAHERVLNSGEQQEQLIEALLTLSRVQGGTQRQESCDLGTIMGEVLASRMSEADLRGLRVSVALESAPTVGDPRLVERLAINLLDNALRHNEPWGTVEVATGTRAGHAVLFVANDGPVVRTQDIDRLFEPFQRLGAERTSSGEGFGLGLCIVKAVAGVHGAQIATRTRPRGGLRSR